MPRTLSDLTPERLSKFDEMLSEMRNEVFVDDEKLQQLDSDIFATLVLMFAVDNILANPKIKGMFMLNSANLLLRAQERRDSDRAEMN